MAFTYNIVEYSECSTLHNRAGFRRGLGGPGPRPPTNRGTTTKPLNFSSTCMLISWNHFSWLTYMNLRPKRHQNSPVHATQWPKPVSIQFKLINCKK